MRKRQRTSASEKGPKPSSRRRRQAFPPTKALREELTRTMEEIEVGVGACLQLRRWADLEAAVDSYSKLMGGADPTLILASAMLRPIARYAVTMTDPEQLLRCARYIERYIYLSESRLPVREAVEMVRVSLEHGEALAAFARMEAEPGGVH